MKKHQVVFYILLFLPWLSIAQLPVDSVLSQIERNNTALSSLRKGIDAEKTANKTGIFLQNPEVGFNYLWSDPATVGNRTDFSVKQYFDFPTAYGHRRRIAESRNTGAEIEYQKQRKAILLEARLLCAEIAYINALAEEYKSRLLSAIALAKAYKTMYDKGEIGILEYNKAQLNFLSTKKEAEALNIEQSALLKQLSAMNGGQPIAFDSKAMPVKQLPADFDQWYAQAQQSNPTLAWLNQEVLTRMQQEKLNRALTLPKASAGYMSEIRTGENFRGLSVGLSVPLWQNKNTVKYAKANTLAWQDIEADNKIQQYTQLKIQFEKAQSLQQTVDEYRQSIQLYKNTDLLKKALDQGEISLLNYLVELSLAYESTDKLLKTEHDLNKALAQLFKYQN
jgi:hypothetical protein